MKRIPFLPILLCMLIICLSNSSCKKERFIDQLNQIPPDQINYTQVLVLDSSHSIRITYWLTSSECEDQFIQNDVVRMKVQNISNYPIDSFNLATELFSDLPQSNDNRIAHHTTNFYGFGTQAISESFTILDQENVLNHVFNLDEPYWRFNGSLLLPPAQTSPDSINGSYTGEVRFYNWTDSLTPVKYARTTATITKSGDFQISFTDLVEISDTIYDSIPRINNVSPISGIIGSLGDFWGGLETDTTWSYPLSANTIPDTTTEGSLNIRFDFEGPTGVDSLSHINCILTK